MIQLPDLSIVKEKVIFMAQANKGQPSLGYGLGSYSKVVSCLLWTFSPTRSQTGILIKFFINSTTGGIS